METTHNAGDNDPSFGFELNGKAHCEPHDGFSIGYYEQVSDLDKAEQTANITDWKESHPKGRKWGRDAAWDFTGDSGVRWKAIVY